MMMTSAPATPRRPAAHDARRLAATQKVAVVNGTPEILGLFETLLEAAHYDVVFVESSDHAYSQIKREQPDLVILCVHLGEDDGFQVLSMLKLDDDTRRIPVLTCATEYEGQQADGDVPDRSDAGLFTPRRAAIRMN